MAANEQQRIIELEAELSRYKAVSRGDKLLLGTSLHSKGAGKLASYTLWRRESFRPGQAMTPEDINWARQHWDLTATQWQKIERLFKADNPEFDPNSAKHAPNMRKCPTPNAKTAKKVAKRSLERNTLGAAKIAMVKQARFEAAGMAVMMDGLGNRDARFKKKEEVAKIRAGNLFSIMGDSRRTKATFQGLSATRPTNDTP